MLSEAGDGNKGEILCRQRCEFRTQVWFKIKVITRTKCVCIILFALRFHSIVNGHYKIDYILIFISN